MYDIYSIIYGIKIPDELYETIQTELKKNLSGTPIETLTDDSDMEQFIAKINQLKEQAIQLYEFSDIFDTLGPKEGLKFPDGRTITRKEYRKLIREYIKELKFLKKDLSQRNNKKPLKISPEMRKQKIEELITLFQEDNSRGRFLDQLEELTDYYGKQDIERLKIRRINTTLDEMEIKSLYSGHGEDVYYIGNIMWSTDNTVFSDIPIDVRVEGNTIYPISFNVPSDLVNQVNMSQEKIKNMLPNIKFPPVGFYWLFHTS